MLIHRLDTGDVTGPRVSAAVHTNIMWSYHGGVSLYWFAMSLLLRTLAQAECCLTVEWLGKPEDRKAILKNPGVGFLLLGCSMYMQGVWLCWIHLNMGTWYLQLGKCCHTSSLCGCDFRFWEKLPLSERHSDLGLYAWHCMMVLWFGTGALKRTDLGLGPSGSYCQRLQLSFWDYDLYLLFWFYITS